MNLDYDELMAYVALLAALGAASERLVEIFKGFFPDSLNKEQLGETAEKNRIHNIDMIAVIAGIITVFLASIANKDIIGSPSWTHGYIPKLLAFGVLTSGGSTLWNSILGYLKEVKVIKKQEAQEKKMEVAEKRA